MNGLHLAIERAGGQSQLATLLGCHRSQITRWLTRGIPADCARHMAKTLNIEPCLLWAHIAPLDGQQRRSRARARRRGQAA